jgi:hypothetical protein
LLNVFRIEVFSEVQRRQEFLILFGLGTEQQMGYYEDEVSMWDSLYPFNVSLILLLLAAIFTRYVGKPSLKVIRLGLGEGDEALAHRRARSGRHTDNSSERPHGGSEDDMLTVIDDTQSISGYSDIRS